MQPIRVVWGSATATTAMAAYDAALADAGVENYNLTPVSSVIPAGAEVRVAATAPDLGPAGERLTVVQGRRTVAPGADAPACAGLGWRVTDDGRGIFYEASGADSATVRETIETGLAAGLALRDWRAVDGDVQLETARTDADGYATAVVLAAYGDSEPIL